MNRHGISYCRITAVALGKLLDKFGALGREFSGNGGGNLDIFAQMTMLLPISNPTLKCILIGFTEITNGISYTASQQMDFQTTYPLLLAYTAFGGLSGFAQTASMVKESNFSMVPYFLTKLFQTACAFLLAHYLVR